MAAPVSDLEAVGVGSTSQGRTLAAWRRLLQAVRRRERIAERETGLTGAQLFALRQVALHPGATVGDLARLTSTDPSSMSVVVTRLLEKKMVRRERDPLDQRRWRLLITRSGTARLAKAPESADLRLGDAIAALAPGEREALRSQLNALADAVER
jgi:DNA-binding MarR family transcriptional regulator